MAATTTPEIAPILISLIPVVIGGCLALAGAIGGGLLSHWLKTRAEKANRRAEKYEELLVSIFDHKHWLAQMNSHRAFGGEAPESMSPAAKIRAISSLYFPEFKDKVVALDLAADKYELSMFDAGKERPKMASHQKKASLRSKQLICRTSKLFTNLRRLLSHMANNYIANQSFHRTCAKSRVVR